MAVLIYPTTASILSRNTSNGLLLETLINVQPNNIFYFDNAGNAYGISSSVLDITASLALTSSYFSGSITNAVSSSYALTASYAANGGGSGGVSASYALTSSYALNGGGSGGTTLQTGSTYPITSSWAITASYALAGGSTQVYIGSGSNPSGSLTPSNINIPNIYYSDPAYSGSANMYVWSVISHSWYPVITF